MKAVVCGAGRVGYGIARELAAEGNSVTVVDWSRELIDKVTTDLDVRGVVGHGSHPDVLEKAGVADADLLVAVTYSDETNMVACQVAHSLFDTQTRIARVRAQSYLDKRWADLFSQDALPIDVTISPELEVSRSILQRLETPGAFATAPFANSRVQLLGLSVDETSPVAGSSRDQILELFPDLGFDILGVHREKTLFIPEGGDPLMPGDDVYVSLAAGHVKRALDVFGRSVQRARRVVIVGAGNIGLYVAHALERVGGVRVRLVERDKAQAERAADTLRWLRSPAGRWVRIPAGLLLIIGGALAILPVFGVWMIPLGVLLIAQDIPFLKRPTARAVSWTEWQVRRLRNRWRDRRDNRKDSAH